jgi:hypothetical protein
MKTLLYHIAAVLATAANVGWTEKTVVRGAKDHAGETATVSAKW